MRLPDDAIGRLRTGDLILTSSTEPPPGAAAGPAGPAASVLGLVVRPDELDLKAGGAKVLIYAPRKGTLSGLGECVDGLPETSEVAVSRLDAEVAERAIARIKARMAAGAAGDALREAVGDQFGATGASALHELLHRRLYQEPSPLSPRRSCPICHQPRPCDCVV